MGEPCWENDQAVLAAVRNQEWFRHALHQAPLAEPDDPLEECANRAWILYPADPKAIEGRRLRGQVREWRNAQLKGWFSLWRCEHDGAVDLLGDAVATNLVGLSRRKPGDCVLARAVPIGDGLTLLPASTDVLCAEEGHIPARVARSQGVLESWQDRRHIVLDPRVVYEHEYVCSPRRAERAKQLLQGQDWTLKGDRLLLRHPVPAHLDPEDDPLVLHLESLCEEYLHLSWKGQKPADLPRPERGTVLLLEVDGTLLRFPSHFRFRQLIRALDCLKPHCFGEFSVFRLSLGRQVMDLDYQDPWDECLPDTTPLHQALSVGSVFTLDDILEIRVTAVGDEDSGPSPWFPEREAANRRLRSRFHSRLGRVSLKSDGPREETPARAARPRATEIRTSPSTLGRISRSRSDSTGSWWQ